MGKLKFYRRRGGGVKNFVGRKRRNNEDMMKK